jgi:hypothetical protein
MTGVTGLHAVVTVNVNGLPAVAVAVAALVTTGVPQPLAPAGATPTDSAAALSVSVPQAVTVANASRAARYLKTTPLVIFLPLLGPKWQLHCHCNQMVRRFQAG